MFLINICKKSMRFEEITKETLDEFQGKKKVNKVAARMISLTVISLQSITRLKSPLLSILTNSLDQSIKPLNYLILISGTNGCHSIQRSVTGRLVQTSR